MNWMTSGRKRVQRSSKVKELRAKHFAKVAADRAMAPASKPIRSSSRPHRQSADVWRLRSRWTQQVTLTHNTATAATGPRGAAAPGSVAAATTSPAPGTTPAGPDTTPGGDSPFQAGLLDLDITPPFNAGPRQHRFARVSGPDRGAVNGITGAIPAMQHQHRRRLQLQPSPIPTPLHATGRYEAPAPRLATLAAERRQLVLGGCDGGGAGGRLQLGVGDGDDDYEGQLLSSEDESKGRPTCVVRADICGAGVASFGAAGAASNPAQWGLSSQGGAHPMRFFDAGVEVALDGSLVPGTAAAAAATSSPLRPPRNLLARSVAAGRMDFPTKLGGESDAFDPEPPFGVTRPAGVGGLPMFGGGVARPPPTPSEPWEKEMEEEEEAKGWPRPPHSNLCAKKSSKAARDDRALSIHAADDTNLHGHGRQDYGYPPEGDGAELPRDRGAGLYGGHMLGEKFQVIARTWGLFGGALDSPPPLSDPAAAASPSPSAFAGNRDFSGGGGASASPDAVGLDMAKDAGMNASSGREGAPRPHMSIPVRTSPHAIGLGSHRSGKAGSDLGADRLPSPPSLRQAEKAVDDDGGYLHADGSDSPELTMHFVDEPAGTRLLKVAAVGEVGTEAAVKEEQGSSQSLGAAPSPTPKRRPTDDRLQHLAISVSSRQELAAVAAATAADRGHDQGEQPSVITLGMPSTEIQPEKLSIGELGVAGGVPSAQITAGGAGIDDPRPRGLSGEASDAAPVSTVSAHSTVESCRYGGAAGGGDNGSRLTCPPVPVRSTVSSDIAQEPAGQGSSGLAVKRRAHVSGRSGTVGCGDTTRSRSAHEVGLAPPSNGPSFSSGSAPPTSVFLVALPTAVVVATPAVALVAGVPSPAKKAGAPAASSFPGERWKRARDHGDERRQEKEKAQGLCGGGKQRRRKHGPGLKLAAAVVAAEAAREVEGRRMGEAFRGTEDNRHKASSAAADRARATGGDGDGREGGGGGGPGRDLEVEPSLGVIYESDGALAGQEGSGAGRDRGEAEKDAYSTIMWYRTLVACLTAAAS